MKLSNYLRHIDRKHYALQTVKSNLPGSSISQTNHNCRYLLVELTSASLDCAQVWIDVDELLHAKDTNFPEIVWEGLSLRYISQWLEGQDLIFEISGRPWKMIKIINLTLPVPDLLVSIPAKPCRLYCNVWPEAVKNKTRNHKQIIYNIPFIARYVVAKTYLPLDMLISIDHRDLIKITNINPELKIGNASLFKLNITEEMEIIVERKLDIANEMTNEEKGLIFDWSHLPVEVEIVLDSFALTLNDLNTIEQGSLLPLTPGAEKKVSIYLNKKFFSQGELVGLEDGSLAVEINKINNFSNDVAKYHNVDE